MLNYKQLQEDFKRLIENNKLSHAYLFFGGDEKEKFIFAQSLANFLENGVFEEPVKLLKETLIISNDNTSQLKKKKGISIDEIRSLKYFLWQKPTHSGRRVAIIKEAECLTPEAQNAALKIVEEPPESALIIFIARSHDSLFPTLSSRLQKIYFYPKADKRGSKTWVNADKSIDLYESIEKVVEDNQIDDFFQGLISRLMQNPVKNSRQLKETLNRLVLIKQFNTNKRLQLRALKGSL